MSLCVPDLDRHAVGLDAALPASNFVRSVKGKWEPVHRRRGHCPDLPIVPDNEFVDWPWTEHAHIAMQGQRIKGTKPQWRQNSNPHWGNRQETDRGVTPSKSPSAAKDGTLEAVVNETVVETPAAPSSNLEDDEMVSWLQYPLDDCLERNYCSDFFGELPDSNVQVDSFVGQGVGRAQRMPIPGNVGSNVVVNRAASAEAAMALGAGRAAGLIPQAGAEAFSKVRTLRPSNAKPQPNCLPPNSSKAFVHPSSSGTHTRVSPPASEPVSVPMLQPVAATNQLPHHSTRTSGPMNFAHFSRPAAIMKANLHSLGMASGPTPDIRLQNFGKLNLEASTSTDSTVAESTTTWRGAVGMQGDNGLHFDSSGTQQPRLGVNPSWPTPPNLVARKEVDPVVRDGEGIDSRNQAMEVDTCRISSVTGSALASSDKGFSPGAEVPDAQEPTITSAVGGSDNSAERPKEAATCNKRRTREVEESECQSEDVEEESVDLKKPPPGRGSTAKRSRAAEVHNLSERRRRDRINEKMKALQELIPNSNKTDKASMLDEAIEYLKMLQLQLQMMSMRSGMSIPSMVMPAGMQHLQMSHLTSMSPMGMNMGIGMNMGMGMQMGMIDMSAATSGRAGMPFSSPAGPSQNAGVAGTQSNMDMHDPRMHNANIMESLNAYLPRQQIPQPLNMDVCNSYMLQQQHQQRQHQHQHHHHHHHAPPNTMHDGQPP